MTLNVSRIEKCKLRKTHLKFAAMYDVIPKSAILLLVLLLMLSKLTPKSCSLSKIYDKCLLRFRTQSTYLTRFVAVA